VVGTLAGRARRRFERLYETHSVVRAAVWQAEDRWVALSAALAPVQPSPATWERVVARVGDAAHRPAWRRLLPASTWRLALAAVVATLALGVSWMLLQQVSRPTASASVAAEGGPELWAVELYGERDRLSARVTGAIKGEPGRSYELWALPEGGAPVSLGLLPEAGELDRDLSPTQRAALQAATKVAVSLEPLGGSRTGAPTGPVLYVAELKARVS
jgi:anti-sigma-K factor RskA